jgi:NAD(P)-dependent dehydrogenase (short-subunit alcohol dehydrogenase family)
LRRTQESIIQLADQVAIITGAAQGIGRATARCLAEEGADIVIADINAAGVQEAAAEIEGRGRRAMAVQTDVADYDQVQAMVQRAMETFGHLDILVNNAGNAALTPLLDTTPEVWDRTIKIHLYGTFFCTQAVVRHMVTRGGGRIVNISSVSGLVSSAGRAAYGAAKGGLVTLTRVLAVELAAQGIRVNAIALGRWKLSCRGVPGRPPIATATIASPRSSAWASPRTLRMQCVFCACRRVTILRGRS